VVADVLTFFGPLKLRRRRWHDTSNLREMPDYTASHARRAALLDCERLIYFENFKADATWTVLCIWRERRHLWVLYGSQNICHLSQKTYLCNNGAVCFFWRSIWVLKYC